MRSTHKRVINKTGKGLLNTLINRLPFEAHVPGYQFCGPGTNLTKRLIRGDKGVNPLDTACRDHDIAYSKSNNLNIRHKADQILENRAHERATARDSSKKEKIVAYAVMNAMKAKRKIGMGCKWKRVVKKNNGKLAAKKKRKPNKKNGGMRLISTPRQTGGVIPLVPIFAGLSALGSLLSGGASVYNAIQNSKRKKGSGLKSKKKN